ncbi:tail assembly chaperone [Mycobacterium phage JacoRen57]|nr:tail assembly chaperone [Mycobacterium phage JacoRen57]
MTQPVKRAPRKKVSAKTKADAKPGDPAYDWKSVYNKDLKLFRYISQDGFVVCLPEYEDPGEGEIFGLMLLNKSESDLLVYVMRQHITRNAIDPENALLVTFQALQRMKAPGVIETLLKAWPEASGKELGKS